MARGIATGIGVLAVGVCLLALSGMQTLPEEVVLYTAPHSEVAPFQRVWNPDTNNDYTDDPFASDAEDDAAPVKDELCGNNGDDCPELPAFNGEDYFDDTPIGCCYDKAQQETWEKWVALKNRVSRLEGTVRYLRSIKQDVTLKYRLSKSILGPPGPAGPAGPQGPMGPQVTPALLQKERLSAPAVCGCQRCVVRAALTSGAFTDVLAWRGFGGLRSEKIAGH